MCSISRTWERAWEDTNTPDLRRERERGRSTASVFLYFTRRINRSAPVARGRPAEPTHAADRLRRRLMGNVSRIKYGSEIKHSGVQYGRKSQKCCLTISDVLCTVKD